ncbi:unnamed protein product [Closterium sp. NIES-54]
MAITIYFIATSLPGRLASVCDALLLKHPSELTIEVLESALKDVESNLCSVASASGAIPPPLFHRCTIPQLPTFTASLAIAATDMTATSVTTYSRPRGKSGRRGSQGTSGGGGGGGGDVASGGGGSAEAGGAPRAAAGDSPAAAGGGDAQEQQQQQQQQPLPSQQPQKKHQVLGQGLGQLRPPPLFLTSAPPPAPPVQPPPPGPSPSGVSYTTPPPLVTPQVQPPSLQSSSQPTPDPAGAGFCGEDPGGASSRGAGAGAESVPVRGPGSGGAGVGAEPVAARDSSLGGAGVSGAVPGGATTGGAPSAGPREPGTDPVTSGGAGSGGGATAAGVGARGERVGAAVAGATTTGGAAAATAAVAAARAGAAVAAAAAAAVDAASGGAAVAAGAAAAATSSSCLCLSVLPSPPESALIPSLSKLVTEYYRTYRPVLSHILASLVTDPRASLSSVSALTAAVTEFASARCLDYATSLVAAPPTSPLAVGGESALGCDALEDGQFELEFLGAAYPHLCAMLLAPKGDPDALALTLRQCQGIRPLSGELPWTQTWHPTDPQAPTSTRFPPLGRT